MVTTDVAATVDAARRPAGPQPFDFRNPAKLSRDHVRALKIVHETFARQLTTLLATRLRATTQVTVTGVEQVAWSAYAAAVPEPCYLAVISLEALRGTALLQLPMPLAMTVVDLVLGGHGRGPHPERPATDIEAAVLRDLVTRLLPELDAAFLPITALDARHVSDESSIQFVAIAAPSDLFALVSFEISLNDDVHVASLCLPLASLQPALDGAVTRLGKEGGPGPASGGDTVRDAITHRILDAPTDVSIQFDPVLLTSGDVARLRTGDVVPLRHGVDAPLTLRVGETAFLAVRPATHGKRLAFIVVDRPDQEA